MEAREVALAVGDVNVDEVEGLELKGLDAALGEQVAVAVGLPVVSLDDGVGETVVDGEGWTERGWNLEKTAVPE